MKKADGSACESPAENAEVFRSFFEGLYGLEEVVDFSVLDDLEQLPVLHHLDNLPPDSEITKAVQRLNLSSPGKSKITAAMAKSLLLDP